MQFMVMGYDGKDEEAPKRRQAIRENHLAVFTENYKKGIFKFGCAQLDDEDRMIGSVIVCEFDSEEELKKNWLNNEPYVTGNVWQRIEIVKVKIPPIVKV